MQKRLTVREFSLRLLQLRELLIDSFGRFAFALCTPSRPFTDIHNNRYISDNLIEKSIPF